MKKFLFLSLACLSMFNLNASVATIDAASPIVFSTEADGRNWKLGYNAKNDQMSLSEYIIEGESLENWTELVSVMAVWPSDMTLEQYFDSFVQNLKKLIPSSEIQAKIIERGPNTLLAEWWLDDKSPNSQHEWIQLFRGSSTIYSLRYTTKNLESIDAKRPIWEKILKDAKLSSPRPQ